jgi:hypothetical protein
MDDPRVLAAVSDALQSPALLWTLVAACAVVVAYLLFVRRYFAGAAVARP